MDYRKLEIKEMSNEKILSVYYELGSQEAKDVNFGRGALTNKTVKLKSWILDELERRFNVDRNEIERNISE